MRDEKVTKNIITKETIAKELLIENNKTMRLFIILSIVWTAIVCIVFFSIYSFGLKNNDIEVIGYVVYFVSMLICFLPSVFFILCIPTSISQRKKLKKRDFFVVTDEVAYKEEKTVSKRRYRDDVLYTKKVVHFYRYGDIEMNSTWYQITSNNDIFYMVVYTQNSTVPQKYYPAKMYEYKE